MQFSSKEDIEIPIGEAFALLSDFHGLERSAIRRGIDVRRRPEPSQGGEGLTWDAAFDMRGKRREATITLAEYDPPNAMRFDTGFQGLDCQMHVTLFELSQRRTRMGVVLNMKPKTMSGRLFLQSLKLAKASLNKRFKLKVADYVRVLELRRRQA